MVTYLTTPNIKVSVDANDFINDKVINASITGIENGFDLATVVFSDYQAANRANLPQNGHIAIYTKDASTALWTGGVHEFSGVIRYPKESFGPDGEVVNCKCDGAGFGFAETLCAQEYGNQSRNYAMDTLQEIITDSTYGLVPCWVHKILNSATDTGYTYGITNVDNISGTIRYLYFPYKKASKCLCDLIDLIQAIKGANAGAHFIITPDSELLVTTVGSHSAAATAAGWPTYYGGSQAASTLAQGTDFLAGSFENQSTQANYVLYHSAWNWPSSQDLTENEDIDEWGGTYCTVAYASTTPKIGAYNIKATVTEQGALKEIIINYPDVTAMSLDLTKAGGRYNKPTFGAYFRRSSTLDNSGYFFIKIYSGASDYVEITLDAAKFLPTEDEWVYFEVEVGPYANNTIKDPIVSIGYSASFSWDDITAFHFKAGFNQPVNATFEIDGMHFAGYVIRSASNSTKILNDPTDTPPGDGMIKTRIINDPYAKDDTLNASDDSGVVAQLCYAELLRAQTNPIIGNITTPYLQGLRAGQLVHIHARPNSGGTFQINQDFRVTQYTHNFTAESWTTILTLTSDIINSQGRSSYESVNETTKAIRPENQDREATGMKMREIDITQPILGKDYPS
jgi:hypothetical protein